MTREFNCTKILDGMKLGPKPRQVTVSQNRSRRVQAESGCRDSMMLVSQGASEGDQGHQGALQGPARPSVARTVFTIPFP